MKQIYLNKCLTQCYYYVTIKENNLKGVFMVMSIKERDLKVFEFIKESVNKRGFPPTVREICAKFAIKSTSSAFNILLKLENEGYIKKDPSLPRALKICKMDDDNSVADNRLLQFEKSNAYEVPLVGQLTAGAPILAVENIVDYFPIPETFMVKDREVFMLRVIGDSMVDAGILNNDYILVAKQNTAVNRDIVVALIDGEATVKTYYKEKDHIRLQPENEFYEPIICDDSIMILGKVIGVFRKV
jgi:repressor LexA